MKRFRWFVVLSVLLAGCILPQIRRGESDVYHGRVVDAETEEPLEGAVVVVLWFKKPVVTMDGPQYFHQANEVLTDAEGKFTIDATPGIDLNPFTYILLEQPWIVIFKPGYGPLTGAYPRGLRSFEELRKGATVRLPKLKTREELQRFSDPGSVGITSTTPSNQIPILMRLINVLRRNLGLDPVR